MELLKRLGVGVLALAGGFALMFAGWALLTGKGSLQFDPTDITFVVFWLMFSLPVYAFLSKKLLAKRRQYRQFRQE